MAAAIEKKRERSRILIFLNSNICIVLNLRCITYQLYITPNSSCSAAKQSSECLFISWCHELTGQDSESPNKSYHTNDGNQKLISWYLISLWFNFSAWSHCLCLLLHFFYTLSLFSNFQFFFLKRAFFFCIRTLCLLFLLHHMSLTEKITTQTGMNGTNTVYNTKEYAL